MKLKIRTMLMLAMAAVIIVPLATLSISYNTSIRELYENRCRTYGNEIIKQAGENINTLLSQIYQAEKRLISSVRTSLILLEYSASSIQKLDVIDDINRLIWNYKQSAPYISDIYVFSRDKRLLSTTTKTNPEAIKQASWVQELLDAKDATIVTAAHIAYLGVSEDLLRESQQQQYAISFLRRLDLPWLKEQYSIVQIDIKYDFIENIIKSVDVGQTGFAVLVNSENRILYCADKGLLGTTLNDALPMLSQGTKLSDTVQTEYIINHIGWRLVGYVSTEAIDREFLQMNRMFLYMALLALIVTMLLSALLSRQITLPITWLSRQMKKVGRNDRSITMIKSRCEEFNSLTLEFNRMVDQLDGLMRTISEQGKIKAAAEFKALQNQINPHFLYNTLNTIKWLALMENNDKIAKAVVSLVRMLKFTCSDAEQMIPISSEMAFLRDYTSIQSLRYGDETQVDFLLEPGIEQYQTMKFILQPIVENSYIHGFSKDKQGQRIVIEGKVDGDTIFFTVSDNGQGMKVKEIAHFSGLGIRNIDERIRLHFGAGFGLTVESKLSKGTRTTVRIPKILKEESHEAASDPFCG